MSADATHDAHSAPSTEAHGHSPFAPSLIKFSPVFTAIGYGILIIAFFVFLTIKYFNGPATKQYLMCDKIKHGEIMRIDIKPDHKAVVRLTSDYCPMVSTNQIEVFDQYGGSGYLNGSCFSAYSSLHFVNTYQYTFKNTTGKTITVEIGRFASQEAYLAALNTNPNLWDH